MRLCCILFSILVAVHGVRIEDDTDIDSEQYDALTATANANALVVGPGNYFNASKALDRCRAVKRGRFFRQVVGGIAATVTWAPLAVAFTWVAAYHKDWYWTLGDGDHSLFFFLVTTNAVPVMAAMGARRGSIWTMDVIAKLWGSDGHRPACCCPPEDLGNSSACLLVGSSKLFRRSQCPERWEHHAEACSIVQPEIVYADRTVKKCECQDASACSKTKLWRGQPWCRVERGCGRRFRFGAFGRRWDYCRIASESMEVPVEESEENATDQTTTEEDNATEQTITIVVNQHLSKFVPNEVGRWVRSDPRSVFRFGSYVDESKGIVTAKSGFFSRSRCFTGLPAEDLDTCAQRCLEEGAPTASMLSKGTTSDAEKCVVFAYNHKTRLCVPLPVYARGAEFKPYAKTMDAYGWSNFKLDGAF